MQKMSPVSSPLLERIARNITILINHFRCIYLPIARNPEQSSIRRSLFRATSLFISIFLASFLIVLQMKINIIAAVVVATIGQGQRRQVGPLLWQDV